MQPCGHCCNIYSYVIFLLISAFVEDRSGNLGGKLFGSNGAGTEVSPDTNKVGSAWLGRCNSAVSDCRLTPECHTVHAAAA